VIRRDIDVLSKLAVEASARVALSIPFIDDETGRLIEPYASPISKRFETLRMMSDAGIRTTVMIAPVIPGLNDSMIPAILERARDAGADGAGSCAFASSERSLAVFDERIQAAMPQRASKIKSAILQMRGGKMNRAEFGKRMHGEGPRWSVIEDLFAAHTRRLGLNTDRIVAPASTFIRPTSQLSLF
jgi:DNA repair photolyase